MQYERAPEHDKRIRRGDDFAGDAWRDIKTGEIRWVAVGYTPEQDAGEEIAIHLQERKYEGR